MKKKIIAILSVLVCLLTCFFAISCGGSNTSDGSDTTASTDGSSTTATYTVNVKTSGGMALSEVTVFAYEDSTLAELLAFGVTDSEGNASITTKKADGIVFVLNKVPQGYKTESYYAATGAHTDIVLGGGIVEGDLSGVKYELGDVIYDFTVTTPDGTTLKASELLSQYKALVLNFWYIECAPCVSEMPYLQDAYAQYFEQVALIGLNGVNKDDAAIAEFATENTLSFPVAQSPAALTSAFGITAYPTTIIIDRNGVVCMKETGTITEGGVFEAAFNFFTSDDYTQTLVEDIYELVDDEPEAPKGSVENPIAIGGITEFDVELEAGQTLYYNILKVSGMLLTVTEKGVSVTYENTTYTAGDEKVSFLVTLPDTYTGADVSFKNNTDKKLSFKVVFEHIKGTSGDPFELDLGEFITDVEEGNESGVYYTYTATKKGKLTLKQISVSGGVNADCILYNLNTYAQRSIVSDGEDDAVTISVNEGDVVQIVICTIPDSSFKYPAASVKMKASFEESTGDEDEDQPVVVEKAEYSVTVKDEFGNALSNVKVDFTDAESLITVFTDANGKASAEMIVGNVSAKFTLPAGFVADSDTVALTESTKTATVTLNKKREEYSVIVKDENGNAVSGVSVSFTDEKNTVNVLTDANGKASAELILGEVNAAITVPEGFLLNTTTYTLDATTKSVSVVLTTEIVIVYKDYKVNVVDMFGKGMTGFTVTIKNGDTVCGSGAVNSDGVYSLNLEEGNYTATIAAQNTSNKYWIETTSVNLTAVKTEAKIRVSDVNKDSPIPDWRDYYFAEEEGTPVYELSTGALYYELVNGKRNYFFFTPETEGVYNFTTSSSAAVIGYYGGTFFVQSSNIASDYNETTNTFSIEIKEGNIGGTYVIGVDANGTTEGCVVMVYIEGELTPDTIVDVYQPTHDVKKFSVSGVYGNNPTFTNFDLTSDEIVIVYNETDGYYHYNTKDGPIVLVYLGDNAPYNLPMTNVAYTSAVCYYYRNEDGLLVREDYTDCIRNYIENGSDENYRMYPLTEDLKYILQKYGENQGFWDPANTNGAYKFASVTGINHDVAWMFLCCYVKES